MQVCASVLDSETYNNDRRVSSSVQATTQKMIRVQNAEEGIKQILRVVHPLLNVLGAWPTNVRPSVLSKIRKWVTILFIYFLQFAVMVPGILYIILNVKNTRTRIKFMLPHCSSFCQLCKYTIVLRRHKEIRELMDDLRNDWLSGTEEDQRIYKTRATIGQRLIMLIMIFLYTGGMSFRAIIPFLRGKIVLPNNTTLRPLPCPGYFILFNEQLTPNYEIIFFIQVFSGFLSYTEVSGALGLCATLCLHMCSMLKILGNKMKELSSLSETDEDTVQKKITDIVEYQTKIKIYFNRSEYVTSFIYFVELTGEVIIMCVIGYSMIMEWENSSIAGLFPYFALQVACVIDVFTICYIGQLLIDEGNIVKKISNTFDWYQLPTKKARSLTMVIIMSNNPMSVTAANVTQLSLITFTDLPDFSYTATLRRKWNNSRKIRETKIWI